MRKTIFLTVILFISINLSFAQTNAYVETTTNSSSSTKTTSSTTTSTKSVKKKDKPKFKKYDEVITEKAISDDGLFKVHKVDESYYFEIPNTLLGKEMLVVSRYAKTSAALPGQYGGEEVGEQVWRWVRKNDKVFIKVPSYQLVADENSKIFQSVKNSNVEPILSAFKIMTFNESKTTVVIDVTRLFEGEIKSMSIRKSVKKKFGIGGVIASRSYIDTIRSFPINIEIKTVKTFGASKLPRHTSLDAVTIEFNHSMILLPENPMKPRLHDHRVGFFAQSQQDYSVDEQTAKTTHYIRRWRLEPKDEKAYLNGKLVEPKKPITFYLDPATPLKWRAYLKAGVEDWNKAFERAGFSNAIRCLDPPTKEEDPEWSPEDARYSVIRYFASPIKNAYGPHVADPRSGEIIESDIGWYHNVLRLLRNWFFVQTAAVNPEARKAIFKDEVMGQLIRFVAAHEVGHTLGLPHNWGSSYAIPVEELRSKAHTEKIGGTAPSIMDYARFNYIAQPEDRGVRLMPGIGEYDKWSIQWGYSWFGHKLSPQEEFEKLNKWVKNKAGDPTYFYGRQARNITDPRSQREDLGNDPTKAGEYGMANLKRILPNIEKWTYDKHEFLSNLNELYNEVLIQWNRYVTHSLNWVGGIYENYKTYEQDGAVFRHAEKNRQKENLAFVAKHAWGTPQWILNENVLDRIDKQHYITKIMDYQSKSIQHVLSQERLSRVLENEIKNGQEAYSLKELYADIRNYVWKEFNGGENVSAFRRNLQRTHVEKLKENMAKTTNDIRSYSRFELKRIKDMVEKQLPEIKDEETQIHAEDIIDRIDEIFEATKK